MDVNLPLLCVVTLISVTYPVSVSSIYFHPNTLCERGGTYIILSSDNSLTVVWLTKGNIS